MPIVVQDKTLQIQTKGAARLSPDLVKIARTFSFKADKEARKLTLDGSGRGGTRLKVYLSRRGRSKSGYIGLGSVLKDLGLDPEELRGKTYNVDVNGKVLEVRF